MYTKIFEQFPGGIVSEVIDKDNFHALRLEMILSDEGKEFWDRAEAIIGTFFGDVLAKAKVIPSQIDSFVAVIKQDKTADIYINEAVITVKGHGLAPFEMGKSVMKDDIGDVDELSLGDITVPDNAGVVVFATFGWRRMLFWDFTELTPDEEIRKYDLAKVLAQGYSRCLFSEYFRADAKIAQSINDTGWFPFIDLGADLRNILIASTPASFDSEKFAKDAKERLMGRIDGRLAAWCNASIFADHVAFLEQSVRFYKEGNYLVAISVLLPRIEGILRVNHGSGKWSIPQGEWVDGIAGGKYGDESRFSVLLPHIFKQYISSFVYKPFDGDRYLKDGAIQDLGRHSAMHGISRSSDYNLENATKLLMIVGHMHLLLVGGDPSRNVEPDALMNAG
jgi:hypothetical protein